MKLHGQQLDPEAGQPLEGLQGVQPCCCSPTGWQQGKALLRLHARGCQSPGSCACAARWPPLHRQGWVHGSLQRLTPAAPGQALWRRHLIELRSVMSVGCQEVLVGHTQHHLRMETCCHQHRVSPCTACTSQREAARAHGGHVSAWLADRSATERSTTCSACSVSRCPASLPLMYLHGTPAEPAAVSQVAQWPQCAGLMAHAGPQKHASAGHTPGTSTTGCACACVCGNAGAPDMAQARLPARRHLAARSSAPRKPASSSASGSACRARPLPSSRRTRQSAFQLHAQAVSL